MTEGLFRRYRFVLTANSPIHIGSEEVGIDMNWYEKDGKELKRFTEECYILRYFSKSPKKGEECSDYIYTLTDETGGFWQIKQNDRRGGANQVRTLIRHPNGEVYFPASSLKGAIRIALIHHYFLKDSSRVREFNEKVKSAIEVREEKKKKGKKVSKKLTSYANLSDFIENVLREAALREDRNKKRPILYDVMKTLRISDSSPVSAVRGMYRAGIFNKNGNSSPLIFIEAIKPGARFEFDVTVDVNMLKKLADGDFITGNPDEFMDLIEKSLGVHIKPVKEAERGFLTRFKNSRKMEYIIGSSNIKIGWGAGLLATTLFDLLNEDLKPKVMKIIDSRSNRDKLEPLTRKVVGHLSGFQGFEPQSFLGWARLSIESL